MNDQTPSPETNTTGITAQSGTEEQSRTQHNVSDLTSTPPALRNPKSRRIRNGKIARLPHLLRESVSFSLYRGITHDEIAKGLNEDGYPEIIRQNITSWARGGYKDWLKTHEMCNAISLKTRVLEEFPFHAGKDSLNVNNLNNFLLATRMNQVLELLDPKELARLVAADPELFFRFINEEFNRQKQERDLEYKAEDRKLALRNRDVYDTQLKLMMLPKSERAKAIADLEAEKKKFQQKLNS